MIFQRSISTTRDQHDNMLYLFTSNKINDRLCLPAFTIYFLSWLSLFFLFTFIWTWWKVLTLCGLLLFCWSTYYFANGHDMFSIIFSNHILIVIVSWSYYELMSSRNERRKNAPHRHTIIALKTLSKFKPWPNWLDTKCGHKIALIVSTNNN